MVALMGLTHSSCKKAAKCDCPFDTVAIARIFQPGPDNGKDAVVESILPAQNFGDVPFFSVFSWTNSGVFNSSRALIEFDLSSVPPGTTIKSAKLYLYWDSYGNLSEHTGENGLLIKRIIEQWDENKVTWDSIPLVSDSLKITVARSKSTDQNYIIDATDMVQDMINNPTANHGFMFMLQEELPYRLVIWASSENSNIQKRPRLVVMY
jgi:hypothetical protein